MQNQVIVVGAGTMGKDICKVFIEAGFAVVLCDLFEKIETIKRDIRENDSLKIIELNEIKSGNYENVELMIEAISENFLAKVEVISALDNILPKKIIFASNTSTLSISKLADATMRKDKFIGMHFFNPATKMRLVELIRGEKTSQLTIDKISEICVEIKKRAIIVQDCPGFIVNRLLFGMLNEAFYLAENKVADFKDIDEAMRYGAGFPMGPFALADLIGLDICYSILRSLEISLKDIKYKPCPILKAKIESNELGKKSRQGFYSY